MQVKQAILTILMVCHRELPLQSLQDCSSFRLRAWQFKQQSSNSVMFFPYWSCIEIDIFLLSYKCYNSKKKKKINLSKRDLILIKTSPRTGIFHWSLQLLSGILHVSSQLANCKNDLPTEGPSSSTEPGAWHPGSTWLRSHHLSGSVQRLSREQTHPERERKRIMGLRTLWSQNSCRVWE